MCNRGHFCLRSVFLLFIAFVMIFSTMFLSSGISAEAALEDALSNESLVFSLDVYCGSSGVWLGSDTLKNQLNWGDVSADISFFNTQNYGQDRLWVWETNKSKMFSKGSKLTIEISNFVNYIAVSDTGEFNFVGDSIVDWDILLEDIYGNQYMYEIDSANISTNLAYSDISATINELPYDVYAISLMFSYDLSSAYGNGSKYIGGSNSITRYAGFHNSNFAFTEVVPDEKVGLLERIVQGVKDIVDTLTNLPGLILEGIKNLFVPSTGDLSELFDRLNQFFSDTFGFLYYPFDFLVQAFDVFLNSDSSTGITFPGFEIMGYKAWDDYTYDISEESVAGEIFGYVRIGTGAILAIFFVNYLRNFFDKRFGGGGS